MKRSTDREALERRLRSTFAAKASQVQEARAGVLSFVPVADNQAYELIPTRWRKARLVWIAASVVIVVMVIAIVASKNRSPSVTSAASSSSSYTMTPSARTVLPGQIVIMTVRGPHVHLLAGGVESYFERPTPHGWQRLYMLHWLGHGEPTIRSANAGIELPRVQATPFPVLVPAVKPGTYRITRRFDVGGGAKPKTVTLSSVVKVKKCPRRQRPRFVTDGTSSDNPYFGTPKCVAN